MARRILFLCATASSVMAPWAASASSGVRNPASAAPGAARERDSARKLEVRQALYLAPNGLRLFANAYEQGQDGVRYPVGTLDRAAFRAFREDKSDEILTLTSLRPFGEQTGLARRAVVFAVDNSALAQKKFRDEMTKGVAEAIGTLRSDFLSVMALGGSEAQTLVSSSPTRSENLAAIQRAVLALESREGLSSLESAVCGAADRFEEWESELLPQDQRELVLLRPMATKGEFAQADAEGCWERLESNGVRIFWIGFEVADGLQRNAAEEVRQVVGASGGYWHSMGGAADVFRALGAVRGYFDGEYVLDLQLPDETRLGLSETVVLEAGYHGNLFRADAVEVVMPPRLEMSEPAGGRGAHSSGGEESGASGLWRFLAKVGPPVALTLLFMGLGWLGWRRYRRWKERTRCRTCGRDVRRDFADCSFRSSRCHAQLLAVTGPHVGMKFPLLEGENVIGSGKDAEIRLPDGSVARGHAVVQLAGMRAFCRPMEDAQHRVVVDGWPLLEPRMLAAGSLIRIGDTQLRFEGRPTDE